MLLLWLVAKAMGSSIPLSAGSKTTQSDMELLRKFESGVAACESAAERKIEEFGALEDCAPTGDLEFRGSLVSKLGSMIGKGIWGKAYSIPGHAIVVKVQNPNARAACVERTALELLDGLDGVLPKYVPITSGVYPQCDLKVFAMELVGESNFRDVVKRFDKGFYVRIVKVLENLRAVHNKGFVLIDVKGDNVRVKRDDPEYVVMIDLGDLYPYIDPTTGKNDPYEGRRYDMLNFQMMIRGVANERPWWFAELEAEVDEMTREARPDYEKWINLFEEEGRKFDK